MAILGLQGVRRERRHVHYGCTGLGPAAARRNGAGDRRQPDNMLFFNVDIHHQDGWARALLDGRDWRDAGLATRSISIFLPFGQLSAGERENVDKLSPPWNPSRNK